MNYKGYFSIQENKIFDHFGELTINKSNKIILTLISNYMLKNKENEISKDISTIYGETVDGTKITLLSPYSIVGKGYDIVTWTIKYKYCLIGEHRSKNQALVNSYRIEFSNLIGLFAIDTLELSNINHRKQIKKLIAKYDGNELSLIAGIFKTSSTRSSKIPTTKYAYLEFTKSSQLNFFNLIQEAKYLQSLLAIITQTSVYISKIFIPKIEHRFKGIVDRSELYFNDDLYSTRKNLHEITTIQKNQRIYQNLDEMISIWFQNRYKWNSIVELLLIGTFNSKLNHLSIFLNLVTALESWNRIYSDKYDNESLMKYEQLKLLIVDENLKKWFSDKKKNVALRSLPSRLRECCELDILNVIRDRDFFIKKCVNQRNFIAHNLLEQKEPATFLEIYTMNLILKLLLDQLILTNLKLSNDDIKLILKNSETYEKLLNVRNINKELKM